MKKSEKQMEEELLKVVFFKSDYFKKQKTERKEFFESLDVKELEKFLCENGLYHDFCTFDNKTELQKEYIKEVLRGNINLDDEDFQELLNNLDNVKMQQEKIPAHRKSFLPYDEPEYEIYFDILMEESTEEEIEYMVSSGENLWRLIQATKEVDAACICAESSNKKSSFEDIFKDKKMIEKILNKEILLDTFYNKDKDEILLHKQNGAKILDTIAGYYGRCEGILEDKEILIKSIKNATYYDIDFYEVIKAISNEGKKYLEDIDFANLVFDCISNMNTISSSLSESLEEAFKESKIKDKEFALKYMKYFGIDNIDKSLLEDRDFLINEVRKYWDCSNQCFVLPEKYYSDREVVKMYLEDLDGIGIPFKYIKEAVGDETFKYVIEDIASKIETTKTVVTHYGDDLDNKASIEALQRWAEDNDLIKIGDALEVLRVPAGQVLEGYLNIDTGGHKGSIIRENGTIIIDGDLESGVKSTCEQLSEIGIYVPEQIVELADTKPNKVSALDSRSGLALIRYLNGGQVFELAEEKLLDKSLNDEQLEKYGLIEAHKKQQEIIDNAVEKINRYTVALENGEKIVLSPENILAGSAIAYEKGIDYFTSVTEHKDKNKEVDGITFAITSRPDKVLPDEILSFGQNLVEEYRIDENSSGVFVSPNKQMIIAGGPKNPEFCIKGETIEGMLKKIKDGFMQKENESDLIDEIVSKIEEKEKLINDKQKAEDLLQEYNKLCQENVLSNKE